MVRWKFLYGNTNYQISDTGILRSTDREIICERAGKIFLTNKKGKVRAIRCSKRDPHMFTTIQYMNEDGVKTFETIYIHKAVADHFVSKPKHILLAEIEGKRACVAHIVTDYENNHYTNLKWTTMSQVIITQPKRLLDPTKAWRTRRAIYGSTGSPAKIKN